MALSYIAYSSDTKHKLEITQKYGILKVHISLIDGDIEQYISTVELGNSHKVLNDMMSIVGVE